MKDTYSLQTYREVMHNLDEIVMCVDADGRIPCWNVKAAEELYYEKDEFSSLLIDQILPMEKEEVHSSEWRGSVYRKNGTCFRAQVKKLRANTDWGEWIYLIKNVEKELRQEEEIKKLRLMLEEAGKVRQSVLANVTHELRTPINGMKGMALLLRESETRPEARETLDVMLSCCGNMERIVNDILEYAKLSKGKVKLEEGTFSFREWIKGLIAVQEPVIRQKNLAFSCTVDPDVPDGLIGDSYHLGQVLGNLLNNAVKFTKEGKISVEVRLKERQEGRASLFFMVEDTGIGISSEKQSELFESFVQVDPSITREFGGTGLGLSIAKEIIVLMQGEIGVESRLGEGSKFYFTVPFAVAEGRQAEASLKEEIAIGSEGKEELLSRLAVCMEFESYEKAEEAAHQLKECTKEAVPALSKQAFRLELALRKGDRQKIARQYRLLCEMATE